MTTHDTSGEKDEKEVKREPDPITLVEFLESTRPNQVIQISDLAEQKFSRTYGSTVDLIRTPEIQLHCTSESCNGLRFFRFLGEESEVLLAKKYRYFFLQYRYSNFSAGDEYIWNIGSHKKGGPGTPKTWLRAGINHHLAFVVRQVSAWARAAGTTPGRNQGVFGEGGLRPLGGGRGGLAG